MRRALVGAAVVVLVAAACGGGGGTSKADYVKQANAVCRAAAKQVAALRIPGRADVTAMPKVAAEVVAVQRRALDRLRAIKPPKVDRPEIAKWVALVDQTIDQADLSAAAQKHGEIQRAIAANANGSTLDRRADEIARAYGLRMCVQAASPPPTTSTSAPARAGA
ncbi:MAG TPA: hypothetical protein VGN59_03375 [Acidimicrobiia bacterium]|jgi:hypothetical protein